MNKYRNERCVVEGYSFPSKAQGRRYGELRALERFGSISDLRVEFPFPIYVNDILICKYIADFVYWDKAKFLRVIEDVKGGDSTSVFKLKKKLVEAVFPDHKIIEIRFGKRKAKRPKTIPKTKGVRVMQPLGRASRYGNIPN